MKKITLLFAASVLLFSCKKKDQKHCWTCVMTVSWSAIADTTTSTNTICDKTESEIRDYEKAASSTATMPNLGTTITGNSTTKCTQQ